MGTLLKRWYVWLGLVLLLGLAGSAALIWSGRGRITQENFDRIQDGMSKEEVHAMLGEHMFGLGYFAGSDVYDRLRWQSGPNHITVTFENGKVVDKRRYFATAWKTLQWYAKSGAAKIGVKWD